MEQLLFLKNFKNNKDLNALFQVSSVFAINKLLYADFIFMRNYEAL
jgi:metal-dependent HD superfamily phosphatase/phosphodiesterase